MRSSALSDADFIARWREADSDAAASSSAAKMRVDTYRGSSAANRLFGLAGADTLIGGGGNDRMFGGPDDADKILGGSGTDSAAQDDKDTYESIEVLLS